MLSYRQNWKKSVAGSQLVSELPKCPLPIAKDFVQEVAEKKTHPDVRKCRQMHQKNHPL